MDATKLLKGRYEGLDTPLWRYDHLYRILSRQGEDIPLILGTYQRDLLTTMWFREYIVKGRQQYVTTALQLYALDTAFFHANFIAGIIADTKEHAEEIFADKLLYMYNSLPDDLKALNPLKSSSKQTLQFANGSKIRVSTSFVSGTYHFIHISEYAAMAEESEDKAQKVKRSVQAVSPKCVVIYECTSRGPGGSFEDMWRKAEISEEEIEAGKRRRTPLDFRPRFMPPWNHPDNRDPDDLFEFSNAQEDYFNAVDDAIGRKLPREYKVWYWKKKEELGDDMLQEYPNTIEEAFEVIVEGQIFGPQVRRAEEDGQVMSLPHVRGEPVMIASDIGRGDAGSLLFYQHDGPWFNFLRGYQNKLVDIDHYVDILKYYRDEYGFSYGTIYLPHDGKAKYYTSIAGSAEQIFSRHGFDPMVVDKPPKKNVSINPARKLFSRCRFDRAGCKHVLASLKHYSWEKDKTTGEYTDLPKHDRYSHYSDAFQTFALVADAGVELQQIIDTMEKRRPGSSGLREWQEVDEYEDVTL